MNSRNKMEEKIRDFIAEQMATQDEGDPSYVAAVALVTLSRDMEATIGGWSAKREDDGLAVTLMSRVARGIFPDLDDLPALDPNKLH